MNLLVCSDDRESAVSDFATLVALARESGHAVATWTDPDTCPPEANTAYDLVVYLGAFRSRHNPGGVFVRVGPAAETNGQVITLEALHARLDIRPDAAPSATRLSHVHLREPHPASEPPARSADVRVASLEEQGPGPLSGLPPCRYVGVLRDTAGYGEAARHQLWSLFRAGLDVRAVSTDHTVPLPHSASSNLTLEDVTEALIDRGLKATQDEPRLHIYHLPPDMALRYKAGAGKHICAVVWETSEIPHEWREQLNSFDQTWVPTRWQKEVFERGGVRNVVVVPFHLDPKWYPQLGPAVLPGPPRREHETVFYSIFQWSERKAPERLLTAYLTAFTHRDPVRLVLKTYPYSGRPDDYAAIADRVARVVDSIRYPEGLEPPRIDLVVNHLSRNELLALHRACDVFVTLHRGEGWGMPIHEALLMGNPVIFTDISAPRELWQRPTLAADQAVRRVPAMLTPVRDVEHWLFRCDQAWGEPDVLAAQRMMQDLHRSRPGADLCRRVGTGFNIAQFGRMVKAALVQLTENA